MDIRIPQLAEGVDHGTVVSVLVKEGQAVKKNQTVIELETKKAVAPIPSPADGTIANVLVKEGEDVAVGQAVIVLSESGSTAVASTATPPTGTSERRPTASVGTPVAPYQYQSPSGAPPPASPEIRRIAAELGIDLARVRGSERGGRIVIADLRAYVQRLQSHAAGGAPAMQPDRRASDARSAPTAPPVDFSKWGPVTKQPTSQLRRAIAEQMAVSWTSVPHVTQFDEADITDLLTLKKTWDAKYEKKGAKLTVTVLVLKALAAALKRHPKFNASLSPDGKELILKQYVHIGIAVDTEAGLIVPVIRDVDKKSALELSNELAGIAERTRSRKVSLEELQGGTFTVSNQGGIGGAHFTPIINAPEVAILGIGRGARRPRYIGASFKNLLPRTILPLSLSYDHRAVDGADAARFMVELVQAIEQFPEKDIRLTE